MIKKCLDSHDSLHDLQKKKMLISRVEFAALLLAVCCGAIAGRIIMDEYEKPEEASGFAALEEDVSVENKNMITCFLCFLDNTDPVIMQQGFVPLNLVTQLHSRKD